jgi:hypothetical protein
MSWDEGSYSECMVDDIVQCSQDAGKERTGRGSGGGMW